MSILYQIQNKKKSMRKFHRRREPEYMNKIKRINNRYEI